MALFALLLPAMLFNTQTDCSAELNLTLHKYCRNEKEFGVLGNKLWAGV